MHRSDDTRIREVGLRVEFGHSGASYELQSIILFLQCAVYVAVRYMHGCLLLYLKNGV